MAASIYATPPPDLSSEDTALSDVSNSSSLNNRGNTNNNHNNNNNNNNGTSDEATSAAAAAAAAEETAPTKKQKRSIADVLMDKPSQRPLANADMGSSTTATGDIAVEATSTTTHTASAAMAAVAAAANAAMQLQLLEAINDAAKKRRKQNNPSRLGALNLSGAGEELSAAASGGVELMKMEADENGAGDEIAAPTIPIDYEEKLSKMFLPKSMEQLKETFEILQQQQQQLGNISPTAPDMHQEVNSTSEQPQEADSLQEQQQQRQQPDMSAEELQNPYLTYCKECGENFETEFKLGLHMLQEHGGSTSNEHENRHYAEDSLHKSEMSPFDILASVKVKLERPDYDSPSSPQSSGMGIGENLHILPNGKDQQWMNAMPAGIPGFPFPHEAAAAAALSAGGYLPLLGVPGFPGVDALNRPPLRIFNPEAYCDLCNKEFCNKYFLKTHKANKHGIYDPATAGDGGGSTGIGGGSNNANAMNQMFQLQMQQQHQQIQQQQHIQQQLHQKQQLELQQQQAQQQAHAEAQSVKQPPPVIPQTPLNIPQQITPPAPPPVFCEICSKRFTNVFAMRRHRAKAHDQSPATTQRNSPPNEQQPHQSKHDVAQSMNPEHAKSDTLHSKSATDSYSKQFQMPEGFRQDFTLEQEEVSFTPQPRKLSAQSQQQARDANFSHDKLKRLGVLNPEAFCELCCKEYCNKYFLRTHKWKRHGIFVPPEELKEEQMQLAQKMPWPFMNMPGMPLNLMMANEKAVAAQRMLAAAAAATTATSQEDTNKEHHMTKRIKLELNDDDYLKANDENQENKLDSNRDDGGSEQQLMMNIPSTPESQKVLAESLNSGGNLPTSPETAMGLQNLQKLQSMIQQLNDLNGKRPVACHICGRELENQYALHAHIVTEHGGGGMDNTNAMPLNFQQHIFQQQQQALKLSPSGSPGSMPLSGELRCNQCDRDFNTVQEFKQHIAEVHLLPGSPLRDGFATPERPINPTSGGSTVRVPYTITPTSSYCEICNKELCNKYFMKTHMQRMHGIEIENGAQIGGVVCNICNKELCSKYFLRVHKHNTHGIIEEGAPLPQPRQNGLSFEAQQQQPPPPPPPPPSQLVENELVRGLNMSPFGGGVVGGGAGIPSDAGKPEAADARYYANYTEVCPVCTRRFRSPKWLRAHLLSDHGPTGVEKLRELEQQYGALSKPSSPTLKIPNGSSSGNNHNNLVPNPTNLAQALQNLNAQHLLGNMPKNVLPGMFGAVAAEQSLQSPRFKDYQCSMCPFTTPYYAFLFIHERSHSILNNAGGGGDIEASPPEQHEQAEPLNSEMGPDSNKVEKLENAMSLIQDKPQQLPLVKQTIDPTTDKSNLEPTNLSTRTPTPTKTATTPPQVKSSAAHGLEEDHSSSSSSSSIPERNNSSEPKRAKLCSASTSPISSLNNMLLPQDMLKEIANKTGKPACYALPQATQDTGTQQMQAFIVEAQPNDGVAENDGEMGNSNRFVPAIIYLPVRKRISGPITVSFNLTPA